MSRPLSRQFWQVHLTKRRSWALLAALATGGAGCGSSSPAANYDSGVGGPVSGTLDTHCSGIVPVVVKMASCHPAADAGSPDADEPAGGDDGGAVEPEAPTLYNAVGDDDDCKYHVQFMMTAAKKDQNTTIQARLTHLADSKPAVGAAAGDTGFSIEGHLADNETHVLPNNNTNSAETPAGSGVYTTSPVKFDAVGRWLIRFHFYERCSDAPEDSPHGHVAFFVDVVP